MLPVCHPLILTHSTMSFYIIDNNSLQKWNDSTALLIWALIYHIYLTNRPRVLRHYQIRLSQREQMQKEKRKRKKFSCHLILNTHLCNHITSKHVPPSKSSIAKKKIKRDWALVTWNGKMLSLRFMVSSIQGLVLKPELLRGYFCVGVWLFGKDFFKGEIELRGLTPPFSPLRYSRPWELPQPPYPPPGLHEVEDGVEEGLW